MRKMIAQYDELLVTVTLLTIIYAKQIFSRKCASQYSQYFKAVIVYARTYEDATFIKHELHYT